MLTTLVHTSLGVYELSTGAAHETRIKPLDHGQIYDFDSILKDKQKITMQLLLLLYALYSYEILACTFTFFMHDRRIGIFGSGENLN
jgi:hypothetical protein